MKLRLSGFAYRLPAGLLFALAGFILLKPWFNFIFHINYHHSLDVYQLSCIFILLIAAVFTGDYLININKTNRRFYFIAIFILIENLVLFFLGFPFAFFTPISLFLLIFGLRFSLYNIKIELRTDLIFATLFLLFSLVVNGRYGLEINLSSIILFYLSAITLTQIFNILAMKEKGYAGQDKFILATAVFFTLILGITIFLTGLPLSDFLGQILDFLVWLYDRLVIVLTWVLYPVFYALGPLLNFLLKIIRSFTGDSVPEKIDFGERPDLDLKNLEQGDFHPPELLGWLVLFIVLALLLSYLLLRFRQVEKKEQIKGFKEERESVFSLAELSDDFKNIWSTLRNSFAGSEKEDSIYDGSSPLLIIREIYHKFLLKYSRIVFFTPSSTPLEYLEKLQHSEDILLSSHLHENEFQELTELYNQARYGEKADHQDVEKAENIWKDIS